jgi:chemotaxis protein CheX
MMPATFSLSDSLFAGAKEVFETMIFMSLEQCSDSSEAPQGDCLIGTITFTGDLEGCVGVCCSMACATAIAANMLGTEPGVEISEGEVRDALGEVVNMVMGSFKARIIDNVGAVQVSIPTVVQGLALNTVPIGKEDRVSMPVMLDEHVVQLSLLSRRHASCQ